LIDIEEDLAVNNFINLNNLMQIMVRYFLQEIEN